MTILTRTLTVVVHAAAEGGFWAEVLELPGCVSQGETLEELQRNIREAIEAVAQYEPLGDIQIDSGAVEFRLSAPNSPLPLDVPPGGTGTWTAAAA